MPSGLVSGAVPNSVGSAQPGGQSYQSPVGAQSGHGKPVVCSLSLEGVTPIEKITFQSFPSVEGIQENYTASYDQSKGLASQPIAYYYTGGNWGPFTLSLDFVAGMDVGVNFDKSLQDMYKKVRWCEALPFPRSDTRPPPGQSFMVPGGIPQYVLVTIGSFLTIRGLPTGINITWLPPWDPRDGRPTAAKVDIIIQPHMKVNPDWYYISGSGKYKQLGAMMRQRRLSAKLDKAGTTKTFGGTGQTLG